MIIIFAIPNGSANITKMTHFIFNPRYFDLMQSVSSIMQYSNSKLYFHTGMIFCVYTCYTGFTAGGKLCGAMR